MSHTLSFQIKTKLTPAQIWLGWTEVETLKKWFCPAPWRVAEAEIDLRIGGKFFTMMKGPNESEEFAGTSCYLEIVPEQKLVWTSALGENFVPNLIADGQFVFTAVITMKPNGDGAIYGVKVHHADEAGMKAHEAMGFEGGWSAAFRQLERLFV